MTRTALLITGFVLTACLAASAAPLATYALSLGAFGLVHVLSEVRYVDERFRLRLSRTLVLGLFGLLAVIVLFRVVLLTGGPTGTPRAQTELSLVIGLAAIAAFAMRRAGLLAIAVSAAVVGALAAGAIWMPLGTLLLLAVAHNLTPIGFLAERLRGAERRRAMGLCLLLFAVVPAIIATGIVRSALGDIGLVLPEDSLWGLGGLDSHLSVFLPGALRESVHAVDLFAAVVYLQVLHYGAVIHVLPRLGPGDAPSPTWPTPRMFTRILCIVGAVSLVAFALTFRDARKVYGVFAAFHAWLEVPILLLALGGGAALRTQPA